MLSTGPKSPRRFVAFDKLDKLCLAFASLILVLFAILWILLIIAAGTAPWGRLSVICFLWLTQAELLVALPVWLTAKFARWFHQWSPRPTAMAQRSWKSDRTTVPIAH